MHVSLLFLASLVVAVSCHPLLFHLEKDRPLSPDIICPDNTSQCEDGNTCCLLETGGYGCCPQPQATCCKDGIHCCPHGYTCSSSNTCSKGDTYTTVPATKRVPVTFDAKVAAASAGSSTSIPASARRRVEDIKCPDYRTECPNSDTCCLTSDPRVYGCCPVRDAVCCADGKHCCPQGYTCDLSAGTCENQYGLSIPMIEKRPSAASGTVVDVSPPSVVKEQRETIVATNEPQNVMCGDKKSQCADGDTCCKLSPGKEEYGCCPMTNAVCCSDGIHCCPSAYTCNVSSETCSKGGNVVPLVKKIQTLRRIASLNVVCPNKETECSEGSTCCKLESGEYACCPIVNAVCCSDGVHCCPASYKCNTGQGTCTKDDDVIAMFKKQPAIKKPAVSHKPPQKSVCPDQKSECASNATCCLQKSGVFGCCPLPFAVCCKDGLHCCPNDYACQEGKCVDRHSTITAFKKQPALRREKSRALVKAKDKLESPLASVVGKSQVVDCPDGESLCPDGFTCCRNASGGYGCCPHVNAVCCEDHKHCCSQGYTCDSSRDSCVNGNSMLPLSKKIPATTRPSEPFTKLSVAVAQKAHQSTIICPDKQNECSSNETCCTLTSGEDGCCPLASAVCCGDGKTCCSSGSICDLANQKCIAPDSSIPSLKLSRKTLSIAQYKYCPDGTYCSDTETCCKLTWGDYGCCSYTYAVCCSDDKSCCPSGYYCDPYDSDACIPYSYSSSIPVMKRQTLLRSTAPSPSASASLANASALRSPDIVVCPNEKDECSDTSTCCRLSSGEYGCCPVQNAICCADGAHCCPQGYSCNTDSGVCSKDATSVVPIVKRIDLRVRQKTVGNEKLGSIVCPDRKSECPNGSTCCKHASGSGYGCCPLPAAKCCTDGEHCCPGDYKCEVSSGKCTKGDTVVQMFTKQPALIKNLKNVECSDGKSECPNETTCCKLASGGFACCPLTKATCCSDGSHCCPSDYTCGKTPGTCTKGRDNTVRALLTKLSPRPPPSSPPSTTLSKISEPQKYIPCTPPGQTRYQCLTDQTCCHNSTGGWACCNFAGAVCCSSLNSCCPGGNKCPKDANSNCIPNVASRYPFLTETKSSVFTATKQRGGTKAIALIPPTVKQPTVALFTTEPAANEMIPNGVCPDGRSECAGNTTCCRVKSGGYGCCPQPDAVCCADEEHCCPSGYECQTTNCIKGNKVVAALKKQPALTKKPQKIVCPDLQSECSDNTTCCLLESGTYGCCPVPEAKCCDDRVHCCPQGYECQSGTGTCVNGDLVVPMLKKQPPAFVRRPKNVICPDKGACPDKNTCCMLKSGQYACCPQPNAVCCIDGVHCCPTEFTCDLSQGTCTKGGDRTVVPFLVKLPVATVEVPEGVIKCPNGGYCPDKSTCCLLESGRYGCCPQVHATCCSDKQHCCPQNFTCQFASKNCTKGGTVAVPMLKKTPSFSSPQAAVLQQREESSLIAKSQNVVCPDQRSECPSNNTCCLTAGTYRCCPGTNAVCCGDREHCCPEGFSCHVPMKTCTKGATVVPMLKKSPVMLRSLKKVYEAEKELPRVRDNSPLNVMCPDHKSECPNENTCCQSGGSGYNCCPTPNAVCCEDKEHCCPKGHTCDVEEGACIDVERGVAIPFMEVTAKKDDIIEMTRNVL